jgi:hypothetical protein
MVQHCEAGQCHPELTALQFSFGSQLLWIGIEYHQASYSRADWCGPAEGLHVAKLRGGWVS